MKRKILCMYFASPYREIQNAQRYLAEYFAKQNVSRRCEAQILVNNKYKAFFLLLLIKIFLPKKV